MPDLHIAEIQANPGLITAHISLPNAISLTFRPLTPADAPALVQYFLSLSAATQELYGPHDFDQPTADRLCNQIDYTQTIRMVAALPQGEFTAYFILDWKVRDPQLQRYAEYGLNLDPGTCCQIAPSVGDTWQNQGVGTPLMDHIFKIARQLGRNHILLTEGVYAHNTRAVHYYQKLGFQQVGIFFPSWGKGRPCNDMYRDL